MLACVSHALLNEEGIKKLRESDIEWLITTDSIENHHVIECEKTKVVSVAPLFAETIKRIYLNETVSELFTTTPLYMLEKLDEIVE